jgi:hypothetical protein
LDFKPDLALFYPTIKYQGKYQPMLDIFHAEFGDVPQIGASVDGMIFPEDIRTDGAALVLCKDDDAWIHIEGLKIKGSIKTAEKLASRIKCENGVIILHFPLVHVPGALKSAEFYTKGFFYSNKCKNHDLFLQKEYAGKFSNYCDRENIFYLPPTILEIFAKRLNYKIPIIGINVMHTQVRFDTPHIFCNFEDIGAGIAALVIEKKDMNVIYDDIFPDKGKTVDETKDIVRKEFKVVKEFKAVFEKNILILLDGKPPVKAVKDLISVNKEKKDELIKSIDNGNFQVHIPYMLLFFNKRTYGMIHIGIGGYYPFDLYPFFIDVFDCDEGIFLAYEFIDGKFDEFISGLKKSKSKEKFRFFTLDISITQAFGNRVYAFGNDVKNVAKTNYFGVMTNAPSVYLPKNLQNRNYLTEAEKNIFYTPAWSNMCLEI